MEMNTVTVSLLDKNGNVQYGLNWGQRENRDPNQSYLQLESEIYKGDFFPPKGKYFIVETDDNETIIFTRAQKDYGCALQTPENNAILGGYIRKRLGLETGCEITVDNITDSGLSKVYFQKVDDMHYRLSFSKNFSKFSLLNNTKRPLLEEPLQQIFFGAPGTGKSFKINEMCAEYENYRTTFHPDTDYASFVGSYKPITKRVPQYDIYHNVIIDKETKEPVMEDRIVYRYVFQAFLKAYIAAWKEQQNAEPKPVFLIIEEINRGNCAQIFGDIFQLLDRNEAGYSDYPIVADDDLAQELKREFADLMVANANDINALYKGSKDVITSVKSGVSLLLPNNLYIWATMNTSDQSLFPIDSAFKRRWDWKYIKIKDSSKDYKIVFSNGNVYNWWQFITAINAKIEGGEIQQEDKKLGYFFAKSKNGIITADRFLSKVIFFLYNDVFKDFGFDEDFFKGEDGEPMTFASYFDESGEANEDRVERFLNNLGLNPIDENRIMPDTDCEAGEISIPDERTKGTYSLNGTECDSYGAIMQKIVMVLSKDLTFDELETLLMEKLNVTRAGSKGGIKKGNPDEFNRQYKSETGDTQHQKYYSTPYKSKDNIVFGLINGWSKTDESKIFELIKSDKDHFPKGIIHK